jgi:CheY-like chemotaxis protein
MGTPTHAEEPRTIGGRFRLDRLLKRGQGVETWLAADLANSSSLVVKTAMTARVPRSVRQRLEHEAVVLQQMHHACLAGVVQFGSDNGLLYLCLPLVAGVVLEQRLRAGPLSLRETLIVECCILEALHEVHERAVLHRDIKPGNIIVDEGRGTEFVISLRLEEEPLAPSTVMPPPQPTARMLRILVVEDNCDTAESLRMVLTIMGHDARIALTGPDGLRLATEWRPDVVLSDIGLPGMDGFALARELRQNPATRNARLLALTGYGRELGISANKDSDFERILTKPLDPAALETLLAGPPTSLDYRAGKI